MCFYPKYLKGQYVACGKCIECQIGKANEWAFRLMLEASLYKSNCMITLTYNNENLPKGQNLVKRDLQLFMKRLRKFVGADVKFFSCGEYGSVYGRPHYHILIFNWSPSDSYFFGYDKRKNKLFRSPFLEKIWTKGFSSVGDVTIDSARYVAIYMQKPPTIHHLKPFKLMSRSCALGFKALTDKQIKADKIYYHGKYIRLPRVYVDKLEKNGFDVSELKAKRKLINEKIQEDYIYNLVDIGKRKDNFYKRFPHLKPKQYDFTTGEVLNEPCASDEAHYYYIDERDICYSDDDIFKDVFDYFDSKQKNIKNFCQSIDNGDVLDYNDIRES